MAQRRRMKVLTQPLRVRRPAERHFTLGHRNRARIDLCRNLRISASKLTHVDCWEAAWSKEQAASSKQYTQQAVYAASRTQVSVDVFLTSPVHSWKVSFALQHSPPIGLPPKSMPRWTSHPIVSFRKRPSPWSKETVTLPPDRAAPDTSGPASKQTKVSLVQRWAKDDHGFLTETWWMSY